MVFYTVTLIGNSPPACRLCPNGSGYITLTTLITLSNVDSQPLLWTFMKS